VSRIALNAAGQLIQFSDPPQPRPLSWGMRADLATLAERARRPERERRARAFEVSVAKIVALAARPLDIEPPSHDDGLPDGWPADWRRPGDDEPVKIDMPDRGYPWDKARGAERRTIARREQQKQLVEYALTADGRWVEVDAETESYPVYRGGRGKIRVDVRRRQAFTASGRRIHDVSIDEHGGLVASGRAARFLSASAQRVPR
jgi:hypothetical protein